VGAAGLQKGKNLTNMKNDSENPEGRNSGSDQEPVGFRKSS